MPLPNPFFEESYGRLFGPEVSMSDSADVFFEQFYQRFLMHAEVAHLFEQVDMDRQVQMMKLSLFHLVSFYVTSQPGAELERIRSAHDRLNLPNDLYDAWLQALVETVADCDPQANESTLLAWCWAMSPGVTYMRLSGTVT